MLTQLVFALGFALSLGLGLAIIRSSFIQTQVLTRRNDLSAAQAIHGTPTPRLGGVGVLAGFAVVLLIMPSPHALALTLLLLAGLPVITAGAIEDVGHMLSPLARLVAACASALLAVMLLGVWIPAPGLPGLDFLFSLPAFAIVVTLIWVTGVCHGFNLIDGVNGLAAGLAAVIASGLAIVSLKAHQPDLALAQMALLPALLGFLLLNWPHGRIFLGDAGAYGLGFFLVWLAILLAWRAPEVSTVALTLIFFWPVADTFLAMWRRRRGGKRLDVPDRLHFHQFVYRFLIILNDGRYPRLMVNSAAGFVVLILATLPVAMGVALWDRPHAAFLALIILSGLFVTSYMAGFRLFRWQRRINKAQRAKLNMARQHA